MKKLSALLPVLISVPLFAQNIWDETRVRQHTFRYSNSNQPALNNILKKLAEGNNRPLMSVEFSIEYQQRISLMRMGSKVNLILMNDRFTTIGPVYYRGMDVSDFLIPSSMNVVLIRTNSSGGRPIPFEHRFENIRIQNKTAERRESAFDDDAQQPWAVQMQQSDFSYSVQQQQDFYDFTAKVNDYYRQADNIRNDIRIASTISPRDFEHFEMQNARLESLEKNLIRYESAGYVSQFNLYMHDPASYLSQLSLLKESLTAIRREMNSTYSMLPQLFYDKALWFNSTGNKQMARLYLGRALTFNPMFAPAAMQLALIEFRANNDCDADMHVRQILLRMNPDPVTYDYAVNLAKDIYNNYLEKAGRSLKAGRLNEAEENLRLAESLCNDLREVQCSNEMDDLYRTVRNGLYKKLLDEAAAAFRNNETEKAERKLKEAKRFREKFSSQINQSETENTIGTAIIQKRYDDLIAKARNLNAAYKYAEALDYLGMADDMLVEFPAVKPSAESSALKKSAAKPIARSKAEEGINLSVKNKLEDARKKAREAEEMIKKFGLDDDRELADLMANLKSRIFSQECANAQAAFNDLYKKGNTAATELDFIAARQFYSQAKRVITDNSDCGLNAFRLDDEMNNISHGYSYQSMIASVLAMHDNEQYAASLERYREAGEFFEMNNVKRYGLRHLSLDEFTETRCRNNFVKFMADKALLDTEPDKALKLFRIVLSRGTEPKQIAGSLNRLGRALATRDKPQNPKANPKKQVEQYTQGDKKLKELRNGYLRQWKSLK